LNSFGGTLDEIKVNMTKLDEDKLKATEFEGHTKHVEDLYDKLDIKIDATRDNVLTLEHYAERFIPMKI